MKITEKWKEEWNITAEAQDDGRVWLYLRAGPMNGGCFLSVGQARSFASEIIDAADLALQKKETNEQAPD